MKLTSRWYPLVRTFLLVLILLAAVGSGLYFYQAARAADGDLQVSIIAGYNLVVDSNVQSPSTYGPSVATVIGKFCNTSSSTLPNVTASIGNYVDGTAANDTPGVYPARTLTSANYAWQSSSYTYSFTHLGGTADASRFIGDIPAGQCKVQYWSFVYPRCENNQTPPCSGDAVWGLTRDPNDDLWLEFDVWGKSVNAAGTVVDVDDATWRMTMRNEISAMANKIEPNPDGMWFNTDTSVVQAGEVITSNGVYYTFGNVNKGFDNDSDLQFDYNAWMQPFGDPSYDPSCFRLIRTTGLVTVTRGSAPDLVLDFTDNLYFTNLPSDNTNVTGIVHYTFLALGGVCTTAMTPYQEAASGADNEKFNADYGAGVPPTQSYAPLIVVDKSGDASEVEGGTVSYSIPFRNDGNSSAGLTLSSGYDVEMPFTIQDTVPAGLRYDCDSAAATLGYTPTTSPGYRIVYSNDGGETWSTNQSILGCPTDPLSSAAAPIVIRWQLTDPLPAKPGSGPNTSNGTASFNAIIPSNYIASTNDPIIENEACANLGGATLPLDCDTTVTLVRGNNSIGDFVWRDLDNDGSQDGGSETGIANVTVSLYFDANGNQVIDSREALLATTETMNYAVVDGGIDISGNGTAGGEDVGTLQGIAVIGGLLDLSGDGFITGADAGQFVGYSVVSGWLDLNANATRDVGGTGDDGSLAGRYQFSHLPNASYIARVDSTDADLPAGYAPTTVKEYAVTLTGAQSYTSADFGFGPALVVDKSVVTSPVYEGDTVTFNINLANKLPGDGTSSGRCQYTVWATSAGTKDSGTGWQNKPAALGLNGADNTYAYINPSSNTDAISVGGFNLGSKPGAITKVEALYSIYIDGAFVDDTIYPLYWNIAGTQKTAANLVPTPINNYGPGQSKQAMYAWDITSQETSWNFTDFTDPDLQVGMSGQKTGGSTGDTTLRVDAMGFRITTDQICGGADTTIAELPLTDTYDASRLQFVSASPAQTAQTPGTITWSNLGPLYAGGTKQVTVTFRALDPAGDSATTTNTAWVYANTAKYGNGRYTNNDDDPADVTINATGAIAGTVYSDRNQTTWQGTTGYESLGTTDFGIPGATVTLYACYKNGAILNTGIDTARTCQAAQQGGAWTSVATATTDSNGYYRFTGLHMGFYYVTVSGSGGTQSAEAGAAETNQNPAGISPTGHNCATCGSQWGDINQVLSQAAFNPLGTLSGTALATPNEDISDVNFGYTAVPARIFGKVYTDSNGDGDQDSGEANRSGVTVDLCSDSGCGTIVQTTSSGTDGSYSFNIPSPTGSYYVRVNGGTPPAGTAQTDDPDNSGNCSVSGGCDNYTNALTVVAGQTSGSHNFGYQPGGSYTLGDQVYRDWNGDGTWQSGEENIPDITVSLYEDEDNDGVIDTEDALIATDVTDAAGYSFPNLPNGNYIVVVDTADAQFPASHTQSGDPDESAPCTTCDSKSTSAAISGGNDSDNDFGYKPSGFGLIGDRVWIDSNQDGDQDSGEPGRANVSVYLYHDTDADGVLDAEDAQIGSTTTLNYSILDGTINLDGDTATPPDAGDAGTLYGKTIANGRVDLNADGQYTTADDGSFLGYNVIDGYLDVNADGLINTNDDGSLAGYYQFSGLIAGDYITQVGSAELSSGGDLYGYTLTTTSTPYNLSQVSRQVNLSASALTFREADFGFAPPGAIGDLIWRDTNANGLQDTDEPPIPGVLVTLYTYTDGNSNGRWDIGESRTSLGTDTTDASGLYEFASLPPANDYLVEVTSGVPAGYSQTYDPDAPVAAIGCASGCNTNASLTLRAGQVDHSIDFAYRPLGRIGDTLWVDLDNDGQRQATEPGLNNVTVYLCVTSPCASGNSTASTTTDSNGNYAFGGLSDGTYYVGVPAVPSGYGQTYEANNGGASDDNASVDSTVQVVLAGGDVNSINGAGCSACSMNVDFGYRFTLSGIYTISGTVFFDDDNDGGTYTAIAGDTPYANIRVYLYDPATGAQIASTTTAASGLYTFSNVPNGSYRVAFDRAGQLAQVGITYEPDAPMLGDLDTRCDLGEACNNWTPVTVSGSNRSGLDFGLYSAMDCGDLLDSYKTTLASGGACHVTNTLYLGVAPDAERDGQPSGTAVGDGGDEAMDYRNALTKWTNGTTVRLDVPVHGYGGYLVGWFDWNGDNQFGGAYETVAFGDVVSGTNTVTLVVPPASSGYLSGEPLAVRLRLYAGDPGMALPTGIVTGGEVEDHYWLFGPTSVELVSVKAAPQQPPAWLLLVAAALLLALGLGAARWAWCTRRAR